MLELIRRIPIESAGYLAVGMIVGIIILHGLLIAQIVPYTWANGGRSISYEAGKKLSIIGIGVLVAVIPLVLIASKIIAIPIMGIWSSILTGVLWVIVILLGISMIMQLLGTPFERYVMSIVVLILLICTLRMAIERMIL